MHQAGDDQDGQDRDHDECVDDHPVLVLARNFLTGASGARRAVGGHIGVGRSHLFMLCAQGTAEASRRLRPGPPPPAAIRSVSWKGDRAVRTGDGPGRGRRRHPAPDQRRPDAGGAGEAGRMGPSAPRMGTGSRTSRPSGAAHGRGRRHQVDGSLGHQLGAGAAPTTRSSAWMWLLFAALGFLGGQVLAVLSVSLPAAVSREPARTDGHHQDVRTAHLVHRVDPDRPVGRLLRCRLAVVVGSGDPQPGPRHGPAVPLDRPGRRAHRGGRADPGGPDVHPHRPAREQLQPAVRRPQPEADRRLARRRVHA